MAYEWQILLLTVIIGLYIFNWVWSSRGLPPGPPRFPLIGSLPSLIKGSVPMYKTISKLSSKYGDLLTVYFPTATGAQPFVVLNSYDVAHHGLVTQRDALSGRPKTFTAEVLLRGGEGLGFSDFTKKTVHLRKVIHKALRTYQPHLEGKILLEADHIVEQFGLNGDKPFNPKRNLTLAIVNVIFSIIYGERYELDNKEFLAFIAVNQGLAHVLSPINILNFFPFLYQLPIPSTKSLHQGLLHHIKMREPKYFVEKNSYQEGKIRHLADALLQAKIEEQEDDLSPQSKLTDIDLQATINALFGAGSETTATSLRWLIAYLMNFPQIQENLYAEMKSVFGVDGKVSLNKRSQCHYLEATLTELMRHSTIAPLFLHKSTCDTSLSGYRIPKDTTILLNIWAINHDERQWKNPEEFNPNRFLDSEGHFTGTKKMSYMPFGAGRRVCIGESLAKTELFLISATLLQKFRFEIPEGDSAPDLSEGILGIALEPLPFMVVAKKR